MWENGNTQCRSIQSVCSKSVSERASEKRRNVYEFCAKLEMLVGQNNAFEVKKINKRQRISYIYAHFGFDETNL